MWCYIKCVSYTSTELHGMCGFFSAASSFFFFFETGSTSLVLYHFEGGSHEIVFKCVKQHDSVFLSKKEFFDVDRRLDAHERDSGVINIFRQYFSCVADVGPDSVWILNTSMTVSPVTIA